MQTIARRGGYPFLRKNVRETAPLTILNNSRLQLENSQDETLQSVCLSIRVFGDSKVIINIVDKGVRLWARRDEYRLRALALEGPEIGVALRWFRTVELDRLSL